MNPAMIELTLRLVFDFAFLSVNWFAQFLRNV